MENDFKILLQGIIDESASKKNINNSIKELQREVDKLKIKTELDPGTLGNLTEQLQKIVNQKIVLSNIELDPSSINMNTSQAKQIGQNLGKLISEDAEKAISKVSPINVNKLFKVSSSGSESFEKEMENLVKKWTGNKGQLTNIKIDTNISFDPEENSNIENLKQATITYKNEIDEVIKKKIKLSQIGVKVNEEGEEETLYGFAEATSSYSKALESVSKVSNNFIEKQAKLKSSLNDTFVSLKSRISDQNVSNPIKTDENISRLEVQYKIVEDAINKVGSASKANFSEMESDARTQISILGTMEKVYRNAEFVATSLRGKDFGTVKSIQVENLNEFENKIKTSKVPFSELQLELSSLKTNLNEAFDKESLTSYLNEMDIAYAKFKSLKAEFSNKNNFEIAQIRADGLSSTINNLSSANAGLDIFEATIGSTKVTVSSLLSELSKIKTTSDVGVLKEKFESFKSLAKEAGMISIESVISEKQLIQFDTTKAATLQKIGTYLSKNTKLTKSNTTEAKLLCEEFEQLKNNLASLERGDAVGLSTLNKELSTTKSKVQELGLAGRSFKEEFKNMFSKFTGWFSVSQIVTASITKIKDAVVELKTIDTTLTEISKTAANITTKQLKNIGDNSFEKASKYGVDANDYLIGVQEMSRAGYDNSENMAELSTLAKAAGDMTSELANDYLIASDAAFKYGGDIEKLNALLDGQNQITNRNAVSMGELADGTKVAGTMLANVANLEENEMSALLGTGIATSRESGETVARALKGIFMNLQGVAGESGFDGDLIDEESLKKVEARCHSVGVELEYMKDGIARLRDPMEILKELADVYNSLPEDSAERAGIIADIGGKYRGNTLASILSSFDKVEKMMGDYENSSGSAMNEAMKSANNFEGSLNRLDNTWVDIVENIADSEELTGTINLLNKLFETINKITSSIGGLSSIGTISGGILGASGLGLVSYNSDDGWNNILSKFKSMPKVNKDITDFYDAISKSKISMADVSSVEKFAQAYGLANESFTQFLNNGKNEPKTLKNYKKELQETTKGVSSLGTSLKNIGASLLSVGINAAAGFAISKTIELIYNCAAASDKLRQDAQELGVEFSSTKKDIEDYKTQIHTLYKTINNSSASYEDTTTARKNLLKIQDEMIKKFGTEADKIGLVTDAINGQTDALDKLTEKQWLEKVNSFNSNPEEGFIEKFASNWNNVINGTSSNYETMIKNIEDANIRIIAPLNLTEKNKEFTKKLKDIYNIDAQQIYTGRAGAKQEFTLSGNLDDIYDKMIGIQKLANDMGIESSFNTSLGEYATDVKNTLDMTKELYKLHILNDKILKSGKYTNSLGNIYEAHDEYQNAFSGGDDAAISKAKDNFVDTMHQATNGLKDESVVNFFKSLYPELLKEVGTWEFELNFTKNTDGLKKNIKGNLDNFGSTEDILNYNSKTATKEQIDSYHSLLAVASEYEVEIDVLIMKLQEMGMIDSRAKQKLLKKLMPDTGDFNKGIVDILNIPFYDKPVVPNNKWVDTLTAEEIDIANSNEFTQALEEQTATLNGAELSAKDYSIALNNAKIAISKTKQELTGNNISFFSVWDSDDFTSSRDQLLELAKSGEITPETIKSTVEYKTLIDKTGLSANEVTTRIQNMLTVTQKLAGASNIIKSLDTAYNEFKDNGFVSASTIEGLPKVLKSLDGFQAFSEIIGSTASGENEMQKAFDDITKSYLISQNTLSGLVNASSSDIQIYVDNLKSMGVTNAEEVVNQTISVIQSQNDLIDSAESEYEKTYNEYLKSKNIADLDYLETSASNNGKLASALGKGYKTDYDNWCDLLSQKAMAYNGFVAAIGGSYNEELSVVGNMQANGREISAWSIAEAEAAAAKYTDTKNKAEQQKNNLKLDLSSITTDFKTGGTGGSGGTAGAGSGNAEDAKTSIDWISRKLEILAKRLDVAKNKVYDLYSSFKSQNNKIDGVIEEISNQTITYEKAYAYYMDKANKVGLSNSLQSKIKNGSLNIAEYSGDTNKKIEEYKQYYDSAQDVLRVIGELDKEGKELSKQKMVNITDDYDRRKSNQESKIALRESLMGDSPSEKDYNYLIKKNNYIKKLSTEEYKKLANEFNLLQKNGELSFDEWYEWKETLVSIKMEIADCENKTDGFRKSILQLNFDSFDKGVGKLNDFQNELESIRDMFSEDLFDENQITKDGLATLTINIKGMMSAKKEIADYEAQIRQIQIWLKNGSITQDEYNEKLSEYQKAQKESSLQMKDYRNAIIDIAIKGVEKETEVIRESVQAKKDALQAEQDLHNYRNSISDKEEEIVTLQKKIAELAKSTDRKDIAMRLELEEKLVQSQKDLSENEYEQNIKLKQDGLDEELKNFEETQDDKISDIRNNFETQDSILSEYLKKAQINYDSTMTYISKLGGTFNYDMTDFLSSPFEKGIKKATDFKNLLDTIESDILINKRKIDTDPSAIPDRIKSDADARKLGISYGVKTATGSTSNEKSAKDSANSKNTVSSNQKNVISSLKGTIKFGDSGADVTKLQKALHSLGFNIGDSGFDGKFGNNTLAAAKSFQKNTTKVKGEVISADGIVGTKTKKKFKINGYKNGAQDIKQDELAITQENGIEAILSPVHGMLTPLQKGSSVFTAEQTEHLREFSLISPNILMSKNAHNIPSSFTEYNPVNIEKIDNSITVHGITREEINKTIEQAKKDTMETTFNKLGDVYKRTNKLTR